MSQLIDETREGWRLWDEARLDLKGLQCSTPQAARTVAATLGPTPA